MSLQSFTKLKTSGCFSDKTPICFPAAVDCLSLNADVPIGIYEEYIAAFLEQEKQGVDKKRTKRTIMMVLESIGLGRKDIRFRKSKTLEETKRILENAVEGGFRIIIDINPYHTVGLIPVANGWIIIDNGQLSATMTIEEIHRKLPKNQYNIAIITPKRKHP